MMIYFQTENACVCDTDARCPMLSRPYPDEREELPVPRPMAKQHPRNVRQVQSVRVQGVFI